MSNPVKQTYRAMNTLSFSFIAAVLICVADIICMKMCVVRSPKAEVIYNLVWAVVVITVFTLIEIFSL